MQLRIARETGYLRVELQHRETAEEMREAIWTILGECRRHGVSSVLIATRASRPARFRQVHRHHGAAEEYRRARVFRRARRGALAARGPEPVRRYSFNRIVLAGAPAEPGVYALWHGEEIIYYGRAYNGATIRSCLLDHCERRTPATHYSREITAQPAAREGELLREYQAANGRLPRLNAPNAA